VALVAPISSSRIDSVSPADLRPVGSVAVPDTEEIAAIVARARDVATTWSTMPARDRRAHLLKVRGALVEHGDTIVDAAVAETGKPASDAWQELLVGALMTNYAAKAAGRLLAPQRIGTWPVVVKRGRVEYSPYGVIATITPWNWPIAISLQSLPFALAAGNVVVNKPSEYTPVTGQALADAVNSAGLDLVHVVQGDGRAGRDLILAGVDKIAFTGSTRTGQKVLAAAAERLTPVVMELGGKDSLIVCADADLKQAARAAAASAFANAGQTCVASERIIVVDQVYDAFVAELREVVRSLRTGAGPTDHLGAIVQPQQMDIFDARVADAVRGGATVLEGGHRLPGRPGWYFEPTVLVDVDPDSELLREESFGPILSVIRVADDDEAVAVTNASPYGLNGSVYSRSRRRARGIASRLSTGGVQINDVLMGAAVPSMPFGGEKSSGYGRLQGAAGLREFSRSRSVIEPRVPGIPGLTPLLLSGRKPSPDVLRRALGALYSPTLKARISSARGR
jgi:acyl-CoA reductase-like NAD-dependent aldehyde dehydrogenase